jgi:hypothetical protein
VLPPLCVVPPLFAPPLVGVLVALVPPLLELESLDVVAFALAPAAASVVLALVSGVPAETATS